MGASSSTQSREAPSSVVVSKGARENGDVRRNPEFVKELVATAFPGEVATMFDAFQCGTRPMSKTTGADGKTVLKAGPYQWVTYGEVQKRVDAVGSGMLHLGLAPANDLGHKLVGLYSKNRLEWCIAEQACHAFGVADVPLYDTLGSEAIAFILGQTGMTTVFTDVTGVAKLLSVKKENIDNQASKLANIVQFESDMISEADKKAAVEAGVRLLSFRDVEDAGTFNPAKHQPPKPGDLAFICYTSGTTGLPKGAMITHANMIADASTAWTAHYGLTETDVHISYLPLAHVLERLFMTAFLMAGASIGFYQGDTLKITEDLVALRPTVFASVPRLYNRIYDKITGGVDAAGGLKKALFNAALEGKKYWLYRDNTLGHSVWDPLVFRKLAGRVGLDRCRLMLTGSAPIAPHVMEFLRLVFGCRVCEGYGMTESSGAACFTSFYNQRGIGHVGGPAACNEIKLVSVPEMSYLVTDTVHDRQIDPESGATLNAGSRCQGRGEVCYRGANIFSGYYRDAVKTAEAIDSEGWLHSGDIGLWDGDGNLKIIDRKKNIFKLSQGEYVAAEKCENIFSKSSLVAQCFVYGDSLHAVLVGIVVPDPDGIQAWAKKQDAATSAQYVGKGLEELVKLPAVKKAILDDMVSVGKSAKLTGFELVRDVYLEAKPWTVEDGILTPSFKLKRADAKKRYQKQIDEMYQRVDKVAGKAGLKQGEK